MSAESAEFVARMFVAMWVIGVIPAMFMDLDLPPRTAARWRLASPVWPFALLAIGLRKGPPYVARRVRAVWKDALGVPQVHTVACPWCMWFDRQETPWSGFEGEQEDRRQARALDAHVWEKHRDLRPDPAVEERCVCGAGTRYTTPCPRCGGMGRGRGRGR